MRLVRLWFADVVGQLKSVVIAPAELEEVFKEGIGFNSSSIQDTTRVYEDDMIVRPNTETFSILSWRGESVPAARAFCNMLTRDNEPVRSNPRSIPRRAFDKTADMGLSCFIHPEVKFYLFHPKNDPSREPVPIDNSSYFGHMTRSLTWDFKCDAILTPEDMGISAEFSHHEAGPGQNGIGLRSTDVLRTVDNVVTLRTVVERIAIERRVHTPFMPKPLVNSSGNGMYTHFLLFKGDRPTFHDTTDPGGPLRVD